MISFERRVSLETVNLALPPTTRHAPSFPIPALHVPNSYAPISPSPISSTPGLYLLNQPWCNFCDDYHEEQTCEVMKESKEGIFGKNQASIVNNSVVNSLEFEDEEVHLVNSKANNYNRIPRNGNYNKNNYNSLFAPKQTTP